MRAINANAKNKSLALFKDHSGEWNWLGIVTNSWMDREKDILTSDAHRKFVTAIDSGIYKDFFGKDAPDLWIWHVPVPVGKATMVAYDERGFLIAAGKGLEGEFYDKVFESIAQKEAEEPGHFGMSHGMPPEFLREGDSLPDVDHNLVINSYMSEEFSFLPLERAANLGTAMGGVMLKTEEKSDYLEVDNDKEEWFIGVFGKETVAEFGSRLDEIGIALNVAGVPNKELDNMADSTDGQETVAEETLAEEVVEEDAVEDKATTDEEEEEEETTSEDKQEDDDDEEEEDDDEKEFVTSKDLELVVSEIVKGVAEPVQQMQAELELIKAEQAEIRKEIETMRTSEDGRVAEKVKDMPQASLASVIARSIVGQEGAQIDYNKERSLHQAGPDETEHILGANQTGIPSIDALIKEQQAKRKVSVAYTGGQ
jgi:hypothetical protein